MIVWFKAKSSWLNLTLVPSNDFSISESIVLKFLVDTPAIAWMYLK